MVTKVLLNDCEHSEFYEDREFNVALPRLETQLTPLWSSRANRERVCRVGDVLLVSMFQVFSAGCGVFPRNAG